jgi:hypothetical protein
VFSGGAIDGAHDTSRLNATRLADAGDGDLPRRLGVEL